MSEREASGVSGEADLLEPVYDWLVNEVFFPFDFRTDEKPPWLDVERLAAKFGLRGMARPPRTTATASCSRRAGRNECHRPHLS